MMTAFEEYEELAERRLILQQKVNNLNKKFEKHPTAALVMKMRGVKSEIKSLDARMSEIVEGLNEEDRKLCTGI